MLAARGAYRAAMEHRYAAALELCAAVDGQRITAKYLPGDDMAAHAARERLITAERVYADASAVLAEWGTAVSGRSTPSLSSPVATAHEHHWVESGPDQDRCLTCGLIS